LLLYLFSMLIDPSLIVLYLIAIGCIIHGAYRSIVVLKIVTEQQIPVDESSLKLRNIIIFPILGSIMLVVMFFFLGVIYYFLLVIIGLLSLICISFVIYPAVEKLFSVTFRDGSGPFINVPKIGKIFAQHILVVLLAIGLILTWLFTGNWFVVDVIACCIGISQMAFIRLPNLKYSVILLSLFLIYDVFWVFISPLFFGKSVMVDVAERVTTSLPLALAMPHFFDIGYSLLGLGDIVLPGLFICFVYGFEDYLRQRNRRKPGVSYFVIVLIGYTVGFAATLLSFVIMKKGQPALLYLGPFTLIPVILSAWFRDQLKEMWEGVNGSLEDAKLQSISVENQTLLSADRDD